MRHKLEIVGPYPPPLGGISVHIERIEQFLKREKVDYSIFNHGSYCGPNIVATNKSALWYIKYLFTNRGRVTHFHQFSRFHFPYYLLFSLFSRSKIMVTIHNESILNYGTAQKRLVLFFLKYTRLAVLICVSEKLSKLLIENGINNVWLPAYVPPQNQKNKRLKKIAGKDYFLYSVWKLDRYTAQSTYNIDLAFSLLKRVKEQYHMLFLIGTESGSDKKYALELVEKFEVSDSITILYESALTDYLRNCAFLLRTNIVDAYGVSLQEAIDLSVPAIASDTCTRPKGTILFKNDNFDDLLERIQNLTRYRNQSAVEKPSFHEKLLEMYKNHLRQ